MAAPAQFEGLYKDANVATSLAGRSRVPLLKVARKTQAIEDLTAQLFSTHPHFEADRAILGASDTDRARLLKAALHQQWTGVAEYSPQFFSVYRACSRRQQLQRAFVRCALDGTSHGFDGVDRALIRHGAVVADLYDTWFLAWAQAVQGNEVARALEADDKAGAVPKELFNHYTIITRDDAGAYTQAAYATHFPEEIGAIVGAFDDWIADLKHAEGDEPVKAQYLDYLTQYRACLAETKIGKLEGAWELLDEKWMVIKHHIQVVHDIEYGYGDPLRCKVEPEFSVRIMDETYGEENRTISRIQGIMVDYFKGRDAPLARSGLSALQKTMAGLYYLPYLCGAMLHFRFSGQSIPNRSSVRENHGCKIYFDPVSTAAREVFARELAERVCADSSRKELIATIPTLVYHVAAHEIGHAIYGLDAVQDVIKTSTKTLLEEPRAELTALHTMRLLLEAGMITEAQVQEFLCSFMLQDLRRYAMWDSSATRPYTVSAISCWKRASELSYVGLDDDGKVVFDDSKALAFVGQCSSLFEEILDAEDRRDGPAIEGILAAMEAAEAADIVKHLVRCLFADAKGQQ